MFLRALAIVLLGSTMMRAGEAPALFSLETGGGAWTQYEPEGNLTGSSYPVVRHHAGTLMIVSPYHMVVDVATGVMQRQARTSFDGMGEFIQADGDAPVFWTTPSPTPTPKPIFIRDWMTGEKQGETTIPDGMYPAFIDDHGVVSFGQQNTMMTCGLTGENPHQVSLAASGIAGSEFRVAADDRWVALAFRNNSYAMRVAIFDRATLEFKGIYPCPQGTPEVRDDLLTFSAGSSPGGYAAIYHLPGVVPIGGGVTDVPSLQSVTGVRLVEGGFWAACQLKTVEGSVFLHYDVDEEGNTRLRHRVRPPTGEIFSPLFVSWVATKDMVAVVDPGKSLWMWRRDAALDPHQPVIDVEAVAAGQEGGVAQARLVLSDPTDHPVSVTVRAQSASALEGADFAPWSAQVTIPTGAKELPLEVPILADQVLEAHETFDLVLEQVTGALPDVRRAPLVIQGNGYNLEVNPRVFAGGRLKWDQIYGSDGRYLVGQATPVDGVTSVKAGVMSVDMETGNQVAMFSEGYYNPGFYQFATRDGIAVVSGSSGLGAWNIATGVKVGGWTYPFSGSLVAMVDATKVLIRQYYPRSVSLCSLTDGTVLASIPTEEYWSVAVSQDPGNGQPSSIHLFKSGGATFDRVRYSRLCELDPNTLAATEIAVWPAWNQDSRDSLTIQAITADKVILAAYRGLVALDRTTGKPLWCRTSSTASNDGFGCAISGNAMASGNIDAGPFVPLSSVNIVELDRGAIVASLKPEDLDANGEWWSSAIWPYSGGWVLTSGVKSIRVVRTPDRPNVKIVPPEVIKDNGPQTLRVVPLEGFSGMFPIKLREFELFDREVAGKDQLLKVVPADLQLPASGVDFTVEARRPVAGYEFAGLRASAAGREVLLSGHQRLKMDGHTLPAPGNAFTTGGPIRATRARSVAAGEDLLAFGYPLELMPDGIRTGVVDVYQRTTGVFLRSIPTPAGADGKYFAHSVGVAGSKVIVGAPGEKTMGRTFVFDGNTGALIRELILKGKAGGFGTTIEANNRWIAVSAPGPSRPVTSEAMLKEPGTVMVFDAVTLNAVFTKTTKGEWQGNTLGLTGDRLYVSAHGAKVKNLIHAGVVRAFSLPKGKLLGTITARQPKALDYFGASVAASDSVVAISGVFDEENNAAAFQVYDASNLGFLGLYSMPGDQFSYSRVEVHGDWMIGGGDTLRFFLPGNPRPVASRQITDPGGFTYPLPYFTRSKIAAYGDNLYWADYVPRQMAMPEKPTATGTLLAASVRSSLVTPPVTPDVNRDGVTDEIDMLYHHRGDLSLPARAMLGESGADGQVFRVEADDKIPENMDVWFEISTDLSRWEPVLEWRHNEPGWRDAGGVKLPAGPDSRAEALVRSASGSVFFRTRALAR